MGKGGHQVLERSFALAHVPVMHMPRIRPAVAWTAIALPFTASEAFAYRPFDSTDPAVADYGQFEVEFGPLSYRHDDSGTTWIVPQLRLNYGFAEDWEIVLEGQGEYPQHDQSRLVENALSLKHVFREGTLQDKEGPSVATEFGLLLPGANDEHGLGAEITGIIGQRFAWGAVHLNVEPMLTRDQRGGIFLGTILEGPSAWPVRPVAEVTYEHIGGGHDETSLLGGAIWQPRDGLAFDAAIKRARIDGRAATEIRAGVTFDFAFRPSRH